MSVVFGKSRNGIVIAVTEFCRLSVSMPVNHLNCDSELSLCNCDWRKERKKAGVIVTPG